MKMMKRIKFFTEQLLTTLIWTYYRGQGTKTLSSDASHVKREVNGEYDNYRFLPPWQWTSVKDRRDYDVK